MNINNLVWKISIKSFRCRQPIHNKGEEGMTDKVYCLPDALHNPGSEKTQGNQLDAIHTTKQLFFPDASELCVFLEVDKKA